MSLIVTLVYTRPSETNRLLKHKGNEASRRVQQCVWELQVGVRSPAVKESPCTLAVGHRIDFRVSA